VVEATSGNTGIGLAVVCAAKGYPLVVTMADSFSVERRQLMRYLGAKVVLTPRAQKGLGMYMKAKELSEKTDGSSLVSSRRRRMPTSTRPPQHGRSSLTLRANAWTTLSRGMALGAQYPE
jgi:cysteine synthase